MKNASKQERERKKENTEGKLSHWVREASLKGRNIRQQHRARRSLSGFVTYPGFFKDYRRFYQTLVYGWRDAQKRRHLNTNIAI